MEFIFEDSSCFFQFPLTTSALRLTVNWKWRRIGWKNNCKLWLEERTPEQLKGEGNRDVKVKEFNYVPCVCNLEP